MRSTDGVTRKTKIVCTIGPACWSQEKLGELIDAGMNVARLNFSHGDHATHGETLSRLRGALASRPHKNVRPRYCYPSLLWLVGTCTNQLYAPTITSDRDHARHQGPGDPHRFP